MTYALRELSEYGKDGLSVMDVIAIEKGFGDLIMAFHPNKEAVKRYLESKN